MARHPNNGFELAAGLGLAGLRSAITLWHRWPMMAAAGTPRAARHAPEYNRMISEKAAAATEGAFAAQREMMRLGGAAMTGRLDLTALWNAPAAIAAAGLRPAFRTVKANSRRLSRRS
ncbi:MAG: hypothetical protein ACRECC_00210 [Pseudolabrys sp.]